MILIQIFFWYLLIYLWLKIIISNLNNKFFRWELREFKYKNSRKINQYKIEKYLFFIAYVYFFLLIFNKYNIFNNHSFSVIQLYFIFIFFFNDDFNYIFTFVKHFNLIFIYFFMGFYTIFYKKNFQSSVFKLWLYSLIFF